jgi:hypothetical protein
MNCFWAVSAFPTSKFSVDVCCPPPPINNKYLQITLSKHLYVTSEPPLWLANPQESMFGQLLSCVGSFETLAIQAQVYKKQTLSSKIWSIYPKFELPAMLVLLLKIFFAR